MGASVLISLSEEERTEFQRRCRSGTTPARIKERLSILLLADEGLSNEEIAGAMPVSAHKAGRWRNRFADSGLAGIEKDRPRGGNHGGANSAEQAVLRQKIIDTTAIPGEPVSYYEICRLRSFGKIALRTLPSMGKPTDNRCSWPLLLLAFAKRCPLRV